MACAWSAFGGGLLPVLGMGVVWRFVLRLCCVSLFLFWSCSCSCLPVCGVVCGGLFCVVWVSRRKLKHLPGAYRAARRAQWGGLWPNELSLTKRQQQQAAEAGRAGNITTDAQDSDTSDDGVGDM